jgi:thymidylate kinase
VKFVCVTGVDGSGKSTQISALAQAFAAQGRAAGRVSIWDGLSSERVRGALAFRSREDVYRYLGMLSPAARAYFLFHALQVSMDFAVAGTWDVLLLDGYWYKYYATEVAHGADQEAVRSMALGFPRPDWTFYLTLDPSVSTARKALRSDYESGYGDARRFLDFQRRSQTVLDALAVEHQWTALDGCSEPDQITRAIFGELQKEGTV